ncbi:ABC transporter substrate-binding protein [Clostridium sp.]|uniref:ABC transporter substrate-binding protein n=1 Tax=Clostridium sp. TaxID=1506 RepID=UPI003216601C
MKKIIFIVLCIMIIFLGISVEKEKVNTINDKSSLNFITYNMNVNPNNLKITSSDNRREKDLLVTLFEGLVKENEQGEIIPALAKEFKVSDDGLEYTFKLRDGICYSTGEKITVEDFKVFFKAFISDKENIYAKELDCIFGAKSFREGNGDFSNVAISGTEDNVLSIRLNYRCPYFINMLTNPVYVLRDYNQLNSYKEVYKSIRFTGPFAIKAAAKEELYLEKNDKYYGKSSITSDNIKITFVEGVENSLAIFENFNEKNLGNIDIMMDAPINELSRLSENLLVQSFIGSSGYYLNFNNADNALGSDLNFRKAINSVLSKEYYSQLISKELLTPATTYVQNVGDLQKVFSAYGDTELALRYLKESSLKEDSIITIIYENINLNKRVVEDLSYDMKNDMKVNVVAKGYTKEELDDVIEKKEYDILLQKFTFEFRDPGEYYEGFRKSSDLNKTGYYNEEYENLLQEARYEVNEEKRNSIYNKCNEILISGLNSIPLYNINNPICIKSDIKGIYVTRDGNIRLDKVKRVP